MQRRARALWWGFNSGGKERDMISKGDLVKVRLSLGGGPDSGGAGEILILGRMMNYSEEEDMYILEPKAI